VFITLSFCEKKKFNNYGKRVYKWKINVHFSVRNIIGFFILFIFNKRISLVSNNCERNEKNKLKYIYNYINTQTKIAAKVNYKLFSYQLVCQSQNQFNNKIYSA
jgi:hypothetical protein